MARLPCEGRRAIVCLRAATEDLNLGTSPTMSALPLSYRYPVSRLQAVEHQYEQVPRYTGDSRSKPPYVPCDGRYHAEDDRCQSQDQQQQLEPGHG